MGLELTIYALCWGKRLEDTINVWDYDRLSFFRDYDLFAQIKSIDGERRIDVEGVEATVLTYPLPPQVRIKSYQGSRAVATKNDGYGKPLGYTFASEMKKVVIGEKTNSRNRAIMAYINELPDSVPIILDWN